LSFVVVVVVVDEDNKIEFIKIIVIVAKNINPNQNKRTKLSLKNKINNKNIIYQHQNIIMTLRKKLKDESTSIVMSTIHLCIEKSLVDRV
jgi:effector-binding domain-containing protein